MRTVLIVSRRPAVRQLLSHLLAEQGCQVVGVEDGDAAFEAMGRRVPALLIVDLRQSDSEHLLFLGLLRRRYRGVPVISMLPGRLRVSEGAEDRVLEYAPLEDNLQRMLASLRETVEDVLAHTMLRTLRPATGLA
jgi:DNA-binding NtrC family response regulator